MPSDRGTPEDSPGEGLSLKPLINSMMGGGIVICSGAVVGAAGGGVGIDEGADSTTSSSWTVWCGGDVALGGLSLIDPPRRGEEDRE